MLKVYKGLEEKGKGKRKEKERSKIEKMTLYAKV